MYPTEWQPFEGMSKQEIRKTSADTYQLKDPDGILTLTQEGFDLYRTDKAAYRKWAEENDVQPWPYNHA